MARSRSRATTGAPRQATSRKKAPAAAPIADVDVEIVDEEDSGGAGIETAIAVMTFLVLLTAILFVDSYLGSLDKGVFFKG